MEGIATERARLVDALHQFDDCQVPSRRPCTSSVT
jgi:hypothetical protein